jgi:hypothetical protein
MAVLYVVEKKIILLLDDRLIVLTTGLVLLQLTLLLESNVAYLACERLLSGVGAEVILNVAHLVSLHVT